MTTIHLVHGFNVRDGGKGSTDKFRPYFERAGYIVDEDDYGWFGLLRVRFCNKTVAKRLIKKTKYYKHIGVGHSNGCAILALATDLGANFDGFVFINPALDSDRVVAPQVKWIHVYHNQGDKPVEVAKWLPKHPWGNMGNHGFLGKDPRYTNYDCSYSLNGHSAIFAKMEEWGPKVVANTQLQERIERW